MDSFTVWSGVDLSGDSFTSVTSNSGGSVFAFCTGEPCSGDVGAASLFPAGDLAGGASLDLDLAGSGALRAHHQELLGSTRNQQAAAALLPPRSGVRSRSAADLLALLQSQQQMNDADAAAREDDIDAQIQRLMQLKHVLQCQKQQHAAAAAGHPRRASMIVEGSAANPAGQQRRSSLFVEGSAANHFLEVERSQLLTLGGANNNASLGGLPVTLSLTPPMSHEGTGVLGGLELGPGPWTGATAAAATTPNGLLRAPARHSIDIGGMAQHMSALVMHDGLPEGHQLLLQQPRLPDSLASRAAGVGAPGAGLPSTTSLALSSYLYGPTPAAGTPGMPPLAGMQQAGGAFCDPPMAGLVPPQGWPGAGQLDAGLAAAQPAWLAAGGLDPPRCRTSLDVPLSRTPDVRAPPRKSASVLTTSSTGSGGAGSGRNSPTGIGGCGSRGATGPGRNGQQPLHQAPKWAGSHWHPMADVVNSGQLANKGTGVFIPGGVKSTA